MTQGGIYWLGDKDKSFIVQNNVMDKFMVQLLNSSGAVEQVVIKNNKFSNKRRPFSNWVISGAIVANKPTIIESNHFIGNETSIYLDADMEIINNEFKGNTFVINHSRRGANNINIRSNVFTENYMAIRTWTSLNNGKVDISNNTIYNNNMGIAISYYNNTAKLDVQPNITIKNNCIYDNTDYNIIWGCTNNISIDSNWWGSTDTSKIDSLIYDYRDDFKVGTVNYKPYLTQSITGCKPYTPPPTSNKEIQLNTNELQAYPNPFSNMIQFSYNTPIESVSVYNLIGKLLYHHKADKKKVSINTKVYPAGIYIYRVVIDDKGILTGKIMKQ